MADASNFITTEAPALFGLGTQEMVKRASSLGLTWELRPGAIGATVSHSGTIMFDGDTVAVAAINLTGFYLPGGTRVMGLITPTGNYIIGPQITLAQAVNLNTVATVGNTASTSFVNMPGPQQIEFNKSSSGTKLRVDAAPTAFVSTAGTIQIGININGVDQFVSRLQFNTTGQHYPIPGTILVSDVPAGHYTATALWAKTSGGGTAQQNADDFTIFTIQEVW